MKKIKLIIENVRDIINESDPIGLVDGGAPDDEYASEIMSVVSMLQHKNKKEEIRDGIIKIFNDSFGSGVELDEEKIDQITDRLIELEKKLNF